jgi:hypothetical protein
MQFPGPCSVNIADAGMLQIAGRNLPTLGQRDAREKKSPARWAGLLVAKRECRGALASCPSAGDLS